MSIEARRSGFLFSFCRNLTWCDPVAHFHYDNDMLIRIHWFCYYDSANVVDSIAKWCTFHLKCWFVAHFIRYWVRLFCDKALCTPPARSIAIILFASTYSNPMYTSVQCYAIYQIIFCISMKLKPYPMSLTLQNPPTIFNAAIDKHNNCC